MILPERAMKKSSGGGRILRHIEDKHGVRAGMRQKGTGWMLVSEADLRELIRDEVRRGRHRDQDDGDPGRGVPNIVARGGRTPRIPSESAGTSAPTEAVRTLIQRRLA